MSYGLTVNMLNETSVPEITDHSVFFPTLLKKREGFNKMLMGPLTCRGNQLQFSFSLMPIKMNNAYCKLLVIKGKNIEYILNGLNQWIILQTAILRN